MKKILYTLAAAAMMLTACNKDEGTPEASNNVPVQFSTAITKAAGASWGDTDQIGVFMKTAGTALGTTNLADNVLYTNSASGFSSTNPIYYPQSGAVDFVAYYPYRATPGSEPNIYEVVLGNQDSPQTFDLLYSNDAQNKTRSTSAVGLTFVHKLSKVVLNIKTGTGVTNLTNLAVKITDMPTKADFALATGTFSDEGTPLDITPNKLTLATGGFDATYSAIVIPQEAGATGRKLVFTLGADTYEYAIPNADNFESVKSHSYNITIKKTGVTVSPGDITDWTGTGSSTDLGEVKQIPIPQTVKITAGTFQMGSPDSDGQAFGDEKPQHYVKLTKDFQIGKYAVTFAQYDAFCEATGKGKPGDSNWGRGDRPVINVSWNDAVAYCTWLSEQTGQTWKLPTEAQWEYACRAGTTTPYSFGDNNIANYVWYGSNSSNTTHEVGTMLPNAWGLYDMHGNVYEWCLDQWDGSSNYPTTATEADAVENPLGTTGSLRVLRGGSWYYSARDCRSAYRSHGTPGFANYFIGFRVVLVP